MNRRRRKDTVIAASVTFGVALLILLWLFFGGMTFDRSTLASASMPEIQTPEEELFLEPELITDLGEPDAMAQDEAAPVFKGEPEKSEQENTKLIVPGKNDKPAPPVEKKITQPQESPLSSVEPSKTDENKQKVTSKIADKFSSTNGTSTGTSGTNGAGGAGVGILGSVNGRTFKGCPKPSVELQNKVVVQVNVTIDASGRVIKAVARSKSGKASQAILNACQQAALKARWSEDKATPTATGTLTFTITPK